MDKVRYAVGPGLIARKYELKQTPERQTKPYQTMGKIPS